MRSLTLITILTGIGLLLTLPSCIKKNAARVGVETMRAGDGDTTIYASDWGIRITVSWKVSRPAKGVIRLYGGNGLGVMGAEYDGIDDPHASDSTDIIYYNFTSYDTPGTWRLAVNFEGMDSINHFFKVAPRQLAAAPLSNEFQALPCLASDGSVLFVNFYQFTPHYSEFVKKYGAQWNWSEVIEAVKNRIVLCGAHEITGETLGNWEKYLEQLSGKKIRQQQPMVHERISEVMPVFEQEFMFVNPAFVKWFSETMVPDPGASAMFGWTFQGLYDATTRHIARRMALTHHYYKSLPNNGLDAQVQFAEMAALKYVNKEEDRVMERSDSPNQFALMMEWHDEAAKAWVAQQFPSGVLGEHEYFLVPNELGFWFRRGIDGSADEVWDAMEGVMRKYDNAWVTEYIDEQWKM